MRRFTIGRFTVVGMGGGGAFGSGGDSGASRPSRDYDFDATAEEVPTEPRNLPSSGDE